MEWNGGMQPVGFTRQVWLVLLATAGLSCLLELILLWKAARPPLSYSLQELLFGKFSSFIGQNEDILPLSLSSSRKDQTGSVLATATMTWITASTVIIYNYGAFFSADTLRMFPYMTDYWTLMELENFTLYFLVNGKDCKHIWNSKNHRRRMTNACFLNPFLFKECDIQSYIYNEYRYYQAKAARIEASKGHKKAGSHNLSDSDARSGVERRLRILQNFRKASIPLCSNSQEVEKMIKAVLRKRKNAAFVTYDYEFQHNWGIFTKIMKRRPEWKFANNFESTDEFSIREVAYSFHSGLHERFLKRFEGRFKVILSAGFYGLGVNGSA